jgi:WD40 repeat protein/uncharacterized protein YjbI with pentapeptide repeats
MDGAPEQSLDFFISYAVTDERWATWLAGTLEGAGYRTMLQAWDFVAGSRFLELMDRGISQSALIIAVLSRSYLNSRYGRMEWQAALLAQPENPEKKLITVRVEDCPIDGLLAQITYVDLVGVEDPEVASGLVLRQVRDTIAGRARPADRPAYPGILGIPGTLRTLGPAASAPASAEVPSPVLRRRPVIVPPYPASAPSRPPGRADVTLLHISGPRLGRSSAGDIDDFGGNGLQARVFADVTQLVNDGAPRPDLLLVTGDLTAAGERREFETAHDVLSRLRVQLGLEPDRLVIVPGTLDVNRAACLMHFADRNANGEPPTPPYWPKWRHFSWLFRELYHGLDDVVFEDGQPWTLFEVPQLRLVIAGLNSSMAITHQPEHDYGAIGNEQAAWFGQRLHEYEDAGWLRLGVMCHPPGHGAGALRDTDLFSRLVATRLNLLVHAPGAAGTELHTVGAKPAGAELTCLSLAGPGECELIELTDAAITRWSARSDDGTDRTPMRWRNAGATFTTTVVEQEPEVRQPPDPVELLLDRIEEVCQARYERVRIRRVQAARPYLLVTYNDSGVVRELSVGALPGSPTSEDLEAFRKLLGSSDADLSFEVVYQGAAPAPGLREEARRADIRLRSLLEFQGLLDLRAYVDAQSARLSADRQYPPSLYVPQRFTELDRIDQPAGDDLLGDLLGMLGGDRGRFILLLGDFGCGKTFALRQLAQRIPVDLPHLTPIFIELRTLDKAHSIEGLVAAHLADHGEKNIDLRAFQFMLRQGRIVLLFDGFDELVTRTTYEQAAEHLDTLLAAATDDAKIVVTSRTQHFKSRAQVLTSLGELVDTLAQRRLLSVEPFDASQIRTYLVNHYQGDVARANARLGLISGIENLLELAHNPRMLSFVADLDVDQLRAVARVGHLLSPAALYSEILSAWLVGEERRTAGIRGATPGLALAGLWRAVTALALRLWEANETLLNLADLAETADTIADLAQTQLSVDETTHAIGAGTLLMRTDDGLFGFIHGSVVEWLVANEISRRLAQGDSALLSRRALSQLTVDFLCDLTDARVCEAWVAATQSDPNANDNALINARKVSLRLRVPPHANLRGAALRNEDLSFRDFSAVDLSGADLTGAQLVGANLADAVLRGARLTGTRLDDAVLTRADLRDADLSRARLTGADLRGVTTAGGNWRRAAVIATTRDHDLADRAELRGAAIAPGMPVDTQLYPAKVGVPYGFHINFGRLPLPVAYSADGGTLAVGCDNGSVLICDTRTGQPLRILEGHRGRAYAVVPGPDDTLITAGADHTVRSWDTATGGQRWMRADARDWAWPVTVNGSGDLVAVSDSTGTIFLVDARTGALRHRLDGPVAPVWTAAFSPDGTRIACGGSDATVRMWDTATGQLVREFTASAATGAEHQDSDRAGSVYRVQFHPAGELIAAAESGALHLWEAKSGALLHRLDGHTRTVYAFDFHPSGQLLASADIGGTIRLWTLPDGRAAGLSQVHSNAVYQVLFGPDGSLMSSCDSQGVVRLWSVTPDEIPAAAPYTELSGHLSAVWPGSFRPDGLQFAAASSDVAHLWGTAQGQSQHAMRGHGRRIASVSFHHDGTKLAACGNDGAVRLWNPATGQQLHVLTGTVDQLVSATFNPRGVTIAAASNAGRVYMLNSENGAHNREMGVETEKLWALAFSPNGEVLATANDDDSVRLWNHHTGAQSHAFGQHRGRVRSIAFDAGGGTLATACDDGQVRVFDLATDVCTATLEGHSGRVYSVAFSPSARRVASASWDGTVRIWDLVSNSCALTLTRHPGKVWAVAFSPDGTMLASAGDEGIIDLWDPHSGRHLQDLRGHTDRISALCFNPAGTLLASGADDGAVRLWDVADAAAMALRATLMGLPEGWFAIGPGGTYKGDGAVTGEFWHVVGACRFEPGELNQHLPDEVRQVPDDAPW